MLQKQAAARGSEHDQAHRSTYTPMRPIVAATSVAAVALALAMWLGRAPPANPQHAALARLIASLDALDDAYALGVDDNGALAVQVLYPPREPEDETYEDRRRALCAQFNDALGAEAAWIDGYVVTFPAAVPVDHTPTAVLAAGLSSRPRRFPTRAAARKWFPALPDDGKVDLGEKGQAEHEAAADLVFRNAYEQHRADLNSTAWRALQRAELQAMIDRLDRVQSLYELMVQSEGSLVICPLDTGEDVEEQAQKEAGKAESDGGDPSELNKLFAEALACDSRSFSWCYMMSDSMPYARRVKHGVRGRGRYDADEVLAAGLSVRPGMDPA